MDPPYHFEYQKELFIKAKSFLKEGGLLIYEQHLDEEVVEMEGYYLKKNKNYGISKLLIYQRRSFYEENCDLSGNL